MSKNLTFKGLAFGAMVALASSVIAGAPAIAAGQADTSFVSLAPNAGTSYDVLAGSTFDLKANVVGSLAGTSGRDLKFLVEDSTSKTKFDADVDAQATAALVTLTTTAIARTAGSGTTTITGTHSFAVGDAVLVTGQTGVTTGWYRVQTISTTASFTITTATTTVIASGAMNGTVEFADASDVDVREAILASDLGSAKLIGSTLTVASTIGGTATTDGRLANGSYVVDTNTNANSVDRVLRLINTDSTVTTTAVVTAWVDDNNNGAIDSTEYASPARTVRFLKNADLTVTTTIIGPVLGATGIDATIAIAPELNGQQVGNTDVSSTWTLQASTVGTNAATYNTTTKVWDVAMDLNGGDVVVAGSYSIRASVAGTAIGNTSSGTASARTAADTSAVVAATADATYLKNTDASLDPATTVSTVRVGKSATVLVTALDADGLALGAGKSVTVNFRNATTTTDWTVNGVKVLDNAATGSKVYTTNATGQVSLVVSSTAGLNGETIDVHASPENVAAIDGAANAEVRLTWATAVFAIVDLNNPANGSALNVAKLGTANFDLFAGDQWNAPLTGAYRLQMTVSGRTSAGSNVDFAAGRASYSVTDAGLGSGSTITVAAQLQKQTSGTWANSTDATALSSVTVTAVDVPTTSIVPVATYSAGTTIALNTTAITAYNAETTAGAFTDPAGVAYGIITLGAGSGIVAGDVVTVSGSGLFFGYNDASTSTKRVTADSATFVLDNASDTIRVFANKYAKDAVVTVTSFGRSGTVKVSTGVAGHATAVSASLTAPTNALPGSTFKVTAKLVDAFGNGVKVLTADGTNVAVTYSGPGIVFGALPTETDANGELSFAVLLGSADLGVATVSVFYDLNSDGDATDKDEFVSAKAINVGAAPVAGAIARVSGSTGRMYVTVERNTTGHYVYVRVAGKKFASLKGSTSKKTYVIAAPKGSHDVTIYNSGMLLITKTITVK